MYSDNDDPLTRIGFPHSEIPGSKLACQLPEAYRRLPRPSSPVVAKPNFVFEWFTQNLKHLRFDILAYLSLLTDIRIAYGNNNIFFIRRCTRHTQN